MIILHTRMLGLLFAEVDSQMCEMHYCDFCAKVSYETYHIAPESRRLSLFES